MYLLVSNETKIASNIWSSIIPIFCTFPLDDWSIEQKWVAFLLPLLLAFNNPLFAWTLLSSSVVPAFLDALFQSSYLFGLLLFWLCIFHGLRQTERGLYR